MALPLLLCTAVMWALPKRSQDVHISADGVKIPQIAGPPNFQAFATMNPGPAAKGMAKIDQFIQTEPEDGKPATQRTEAYLGYDKKNLYILFIAFDDKPQLIRARMARRELIDDDDQVGFVIDTFHDRRRGYAFFTNALAIQQDATYSEDNGYDTSWDTVWNSRAQKTSQGWVAEFEIPFKSLRFADGGDQTWGIWLQRITPRTSERDAWPHITEKVHGRLTQEGDINGFEHISPGRNMQFIPYALFSSRRFVDQRNTSFPYFSDRPARIEAGLDSKFVLKDKLVLDLTVKPDFSQVESDEPQATANQRFEVFFPEKRPFFQENATFFDSPISLYFTRRIHDPQYGLRLTGKLAEHTDIGLLLADDRSVGKAAPEGDPQLGKRAYFDILRLNQNFGKQNSVGVIFADREFTGGAAGCDLPTSDECNTRYNRVGGVDFRYRFKNWVTLGQALASSTWLQDGTHLRGGAYRLRAETSTRKYDFNTEYNENAAGFRNRTGFFRRPDIRRFSTFADYKFWREGKHVLWHGPSVFHNNAWSHDGARLDQYYEFDYDVVFRRQSHVGMYVDGGREKLRPTDFSTLPGDTDFPTRYIGFSADSGMLSWVSFAANVNWGREINFEPATNLRPVSAAVHDQNITVTFRPTNKLVIENKYIGTHLRAWGSDVHLFDDDVIRSKWNYQVNPKLSFRTIFRYDTTLPSLVLTDLENKKNFNTDFLVTYLIHPGTAFYVGYNHNLQNYDEDAINHHLGLFRRSHLITDDRQFFVKLSYLFRY